MDNKLTYHYTSYDAFEKIISSSLIRFGYAQNLNDSSEIKIFAQDVYNKLLAKYASSNDGSLQAFFNFFKDFIGEDHQYCNDLPSKDTNSLKHPQYLSISFSKEFDKANQWLCYGSRGEGMMLGFSEDYLKKVPKKIGYPISHVLYQDVIYSGTKKYYKLIDDACQEIDGKIFSNISNDGYAWNEAEEYLLDLMSFVKNKEFSFEKEQRLAWRLFLDCLPEINAYWEFDKDKSRKQIFSLKIPKSGFLKKVVIGPCSDKKVDQIDCLLQKNGFSGVEVISSTSKLRK